MCDVVIFQPLCLTNCTWFGLVGKLGFSLCRWQKEESKKVVRWYKSVLEKTKFIHKVDTQQSGNYLIKREELTSLCLFMASLDQCQVRDGDFKWQLWLLSLPCRLPWGTWRVHDRTESQSLGSQLTVMVSEHQAHFCSKAKVHCLGDRRWTQDPLQRHSYTDSTAAPWAHRVPSPAATTQVALAPQHRDCAACPLYIIVFHLASWN
jgi:hypothetical protein